MDRQLNVLVLSKINEKIMAIQKLNCERLQRLKQADPAEFAKMNHFQTNNPLLYKSPEEKKDIQKSLRKYISFDKKEEVDRKAATMFGEAQIEVANLDDSFESGNSTASQSDSVDEECHGLFFSVEEIELMSDADKVIYMNKLQQDYQVIQEKLDEVIERVKNARKEAKQSI
jgi:hypothetical protein